MTDASNYAIDVLSPAHDRRQFDCGHDALNRYLKNQATQDVRRDLAQTYVMSGSGGYIIGYYTLSAYMVEHERLPEEVRKKLPRYPIPAALIGRLAVDKQFQRRGIAKLLLADALRRILAVSEKLGIHAVIVDAKDETLIDFYRRFGFVPLTDSGLRLWLPVKTLKAVL